MEPWRARRRTNSRTRFASVRYGWYSITSGITRPDGRPWRRSAAFRKRCAPPFQTCRHRVVFKSVRIFHGPIFATHSELDMLMTVATCKLSYAGLTPQAATCGKSNKYSQTSKTWLSFKRSRFLVIVQMTVLTIPLSAALVFPSAGRWSFVGFILGVVERVGCRCHSGPHLKRLIAASKI